jgi:hypothetical protein
MKINVLFLFIFCVIYSSTAQNNTLKASTVPLSSYYSIDTVIERNNPSSLDLKQHQVFIDTSRSSLFYSSLLGWNPNKFEQPGINFYLDEISKEADLKKVDTKNFPKLWVTLYQIDSQLVLYDRCDGISPAYEVRDTAFVQFGPLESEADGIKNLIKVNKKEISLNLYTIKQKSKTGEAKVSIAATSVPHVWLMSYQVGEYISKKLITPIQDIIYFDMVVSHCPNYKVVDRIPFEAIDFELYK